VDDAIEVDVLEDVLAKTATLLEGIEPDDAGRPTPCPDYDVAALRSHLVGWIQQFAAGVNDRDSGIDPTAYQAGDDAVSVYRAAAADAVAGWRKGGADREVTILQGAVPGQMAFAMMLGEELVHGWDLAVATDQPVPFTDEEAEVALGRLRRVLQPEYRGESFGQEVQVADGASAIDHLVAFSGRQPR
jgi:uncharacterized protein (TIGR03086 family)